MRGNVNRASLAEGRKVWAAAMAIAFMVGACGSSPATPASSAGAAPTASAALAAASATPAATLQRSAIPLVTPSPTASPPPSASPSPAPTPSPTPTPAPSTTPTPTPLPSVGAAPAGTWIGLRWISAGSVVPAKMVSPDSPAQGYSWSHGYLAFTVVPNGETPTVVRRHLLTSSSRDGLHWTAPRVASLPKGIGTDQYSFVAIDRVAEGPGGLLAIGHDSGGTCGPPTSYNALWTSPDGRVWTPVTLPAGWRSSVVNSVDGGSTGYIAGSMESSGEGTAQHLWTSQDGRHWHAVRLPTSSLGKVQVEDATNFAGGYVLVGAVLGPSGCGGPRLQSPSVWWSTTGGWWARIPIGTPTRSKDVTVGVSRLSDHALVASIDDGRHPTQVWVTTNGRRWTRLASGRPGYANILTDGRRTLTVTEPESGVGRPGFARVTSAFALAGLHQTGPGPVLSDTTSGFQYALGRTGVLVVGADGNGWLGVPTAR